MRHEGWFKSFFLEVVGWGLGMSALLTKFCNFTLPRSFFFQMELPLTYWVESYTYYSVRQKFVRLFEINFSEQKASNQNVAFIIIYYFYCSFQWVQYLLSNIRVLGFYKNEIEKRSHQEFARRGNANFRDFSTTECAGFNRQDSDKALRGARYNVWSPSQWASSHCDWRCSSNKGPSTVREECVLFAEEGLPRNRNFACGGSVKEQWSRGVSAEELKKNNLESL